MLHAGRWRRTWSRPTHRHPGDENLAELHPKMSPTQGRHHPGADARSGERLALIAHVDPTSKAVGRAARRDHAASRACRSRILEPAPPAEEDAADRERLIKRLLGPGAAIDRVKRLVQLTEGMKPDESAS